MTQIGEKQEAIAKIQMAIDNDVMAHARIDAESVISTEIVHVSVLGLWAAPDNVNEHPPHWIFGSPEKPVNSHTLETDMCA